MLNWQEYHRELLARVNELAALSPDTVTGYKTLSAAGNATRRLDPKVRELIAIACAVTSRCDGCIAVHADAAIKRGADREEIAEALGVAMALSAGAALVYSARTLDALAVLTPAAAQKAGDAS
jgi:AhpD family alkylhydroperoxidase